MSLRRRGRGLRCPAGVRGGARAGLGGKRDAVGLLSSAAGAAVRVAAAVGAGAAAGAAAAA